ncbi:hypothetical protein H072_4722 [Dactylellina haptotyla CBS 200.50]|uniref:RRM domain-containing protein n=1 Tax=Dactylellina haptotyla (strain CBS 200.50) TaxID=1284197 RepID=S8C1E2_DACHA|nr:hypothetical protein H072_4722 [Dactylellina haptotyla CBS 200.50]
MLPVPFKPSDVSGRQNEETFSLLSTMGSLSIDPGKSAPSKVIPQAKTSRFSTLFAKEEPVSTSIARTLDEKDSLPKANQDEENDTQTKEIPRYKAPKRGPGAKAPPTPPAPYADPNPKRLYLDNVPYAAKKQDIVAFFNGFNVECIDIPKKHENLKGVAYVNLKTEDEAKKAVIQLNGGTIRGRRVRVAPAKVSITYRKSQTEFEDETEEPQPLKPTAAASGQTEAALPITQLGPPMNAGSGNITSLREGIFRLACQALTRGDRTPEDIFREINFNDEEKQILRDFYNRHKQVEKEIHEQRRLMLEKAIGGSPCLLHGVENCAECQQALVLKQIRDEEHKENLLLGDTKTQHHHSLSWDSGIAMRGETNPNLQPRSGAAMMPIRQNSAPQNPAAYPPLNAAGALRLYGPKFLKENFPQPEPPIHNAYVPSHGGLSLGNPFHRQNAVVHTQPGIKTHCAFFLRTGHCDFAQQGCKFSHELPPGGIAELTAQAAAAQAAQAAQVPTNSLGHPRNCLGDTMFADSMAQASRLGVLRPVHTSVPLRTISGPTRSIRRPENLYQPLVPTVGVSYPVFNIRPPPPPIIQENHRSGIQHSQSQRQPRLWRESSNWRGHMKRVGSHNTEADGAADDEESDSDLISISSYNN